MDIHLDPDLPRRAAGSPLDRLRQLCLALPESTEVEAWGEPTFRVAKKLFAMYASAGNHHGAGRPAVWLKAAPGEQDLLIRRDAVRFFVPPYVGVRGWVGVRLDDGVEWEELAGMVADSYRLVAPKRLARGAAQGETKPSSRSSARSNVATAAQPASRATSRIR